MVAGVAFPLTSTVGEEMRDDHGDTPLSATRLTYGVTQAAILDAGDVDVFRLDLHGRASIDVRGGGRLDTRAALLDSEGSVLAEDDDRGQDLNFRLQQDLDGGVYYVRVSSDVGDAGEHRITAYIVRAGDDHGNTSGSSTVLPLGVATTGRIEPATDRDVFRVEVAESTHLRLSTEGPTDTAGELRDSNDVVVASADGGGDRGNFAIVHSAPRGIYYLHVTATTPGTYFTRAEREPVLLHVDFDASPLGRYGTSSFDGDWPSAAWVSGLDADRAEIVDGAAAFSGRSLRLKYPAGTYGSRNQAIQARIKLPRSYDELYVSYRVRFASDFEFVKGGKLPGLMGGTGNVGGNRPNGSDGWSARMMWRRGGAAVQYVYHPDQPGQYGEDFPWNRRFEPGVWHTVEHRIAMNTPGEHDGILQGWFDGSLTLSVNDLRFRDVGSFAIDHFYISTFFGGGDVTWAAVKDEYVSFDDFVVSTTRIGD